MDYGPRGRMLKCWRFLGNHMNFFKNLTMSCITYQVFFCLFFRPNNDLDKS